MFKDVSLDYIYNKTHMFEGLVSGTGILLIGLAESGPSMTVIDPKHDFEYVSNIFGASSNLARGYLEAVQNGADLVYLLRINGVHTELWDNGILYRSLEATDLSRGINFDLSTDEELVITNPYTGSRTTFTKDDDLITNINLAASNGECEVYAMEMLVEPTLSIGSTDMYYYEFNDRMATILDMLTPYPIGQVGILYGAFNHKEDNVSLYSIVSSFAEQKAAVFEPCVITMGLVTESEGNKNYNLAPTNLVPIDEYGGYYYPFLRMQLIDGEIGGFDLAPVTDEKSMYINVVTSRVLYDNGYESYYSPMIGVYCGLTSVSSYGDSTTNKKIPNIRADVTNYSYGIPDGDYDYYEYKAIIDNRMQELSDAGYVLVKHDEYLGHPNARILNGVTHVYPRKMLTGKLMNVLLIQSLTHDIRPYLTNFNDLPIHEVKRRISRVLDAYASGIKEYNISSQIVYSGYTQKYHFNIELLLYGEANTIQLSLVTR